MELKDKFLLVQINFEIHAKCLCHMYFYELFGKPSHADFKKEICTKINLVSFNPIFHKLFGVPAYIPVGAINLHCIMGDSGGPNRYEWMSMSVSRLSVLGDKAWCHLCINSCFPALW